MQSDSGGHHQCIQHRCRGLHSTAT
jgi:hypothetical protein